MYSDTVETCPLKLLDLSTYLGKKYMKYIKWILLPTSIIMIFNKVNYFL